MRQPCQRVEDLLNRDDLEIDELYAELARLTGVEDCVVAGLQRAFDARDWAAFERYLWAGFKHPSPALRPVLLAALACRDAAVPHEDVVELLMHVPDPEAVPVLEAALWWYPEWDEFHALAVKCVWALAEIGDPSAVRVLRAAAQVGPAVVRETAGRALGA